MLTDEQKKILISMEDSRAVSKTMLDDFVTENRPLYGFWKFASKKDELNICFRGNQDAIEIYYLNHAVWKLTPGSKGMYRVIFNFNHANGMPERDEILRELCDKYGFYLMPDKKNIACDRSDFPESFVTEELWSLFKKVIDYHFDFKNGAPKIEKRWQHKFFSDFHNEKYLSGGLYIYDLEYQQKLPHLTEISAILGNLSEEELKEKRLRSVELRKDLSSCLNEPDFLGIEFNDKGVGEYLVFGEIKSLYNSCGGSAGEKESGINKHLRRMREYSKMTELIDKRKKDAEELLKQYHAIKDIKGDYCFDGLAERLKIKNVLVLTNSDYIYKDKVISQGKTGGAIAYYQEHKAAIDELAREAGCEIWIVNGRCDSEEALTMQSIDKVGIVEYI